MEPQIVVHQDTPAAWAFVDAFHRAGKIRERNTEEVVKRLRGGYDVDAVLHDDGWVDRERNTVAIRQPLYLGEVKIGSHIALGSATCEDVHIGTFRIARVTKIEPARYLVYDYLHFEPETDKFDLFDLLGR